MLRCSVVIKELRFPTIQSGDGTVGRGLRFSDGAPSWLRSERPPAAADMKEQLPAAFGLGGIGALPHGGGRISIRTPLSVSQPLWNM